MKKTINAVIAKLLAVAMLVTTISTNTFVLFAAENQSTNEVSQTADASVIVDTDDLYIREDGNVAYVQEVNEIYADVISVNDLEEVEKPLDSDGLVSDEELYGAQVYASAREAGLALREAMTHRETGEINISFRSSEPDYVAAFKDVKNIALEHTGNSKEGDYILYHLAGWGYRVWIDGDVYEYAVKCTYYSSTEQEKYMDEEVSRIITSLKLDGKTDYQKLRAVYDYITNNVTYDYDTLEDNSYMLKYTAYAAAHDKTAVCQGYANFFYRLALEAGIDSRIVSSASMCHAWNIAGISSKYYLVDSTWDAGRSAYSYFLKASYSDHPMADQFDDASFVAAYPLDTKDFDASSVKDISKYTVTLSNDTYAYDGTEKKPSVTVKNGTETLSSSYYDVSYSNNKDAGTATVKVSGKNGYSGTITKTFTIKGIELTESMLSCTDCGSFLYSGIANTPEITVKNGSTTLVEGRDYSIEYSDNTNAGTGKITITGKANYSGTVSATFKIEKVDLSMVDFSCNCVDYVYTGSEIKPAVKLTYKKVTLEEGKDYTVTYSNNKAIGTGKVTVTGKGNFKGTASNEFKIVENTGSTTNGKDNLSYDFPTIDGGTVSSAAQNGKPKILLFYSNSCGNCRATVLNLNGKDLSGFDLVVVNWDGADAAKEAAAKYGEKNGMIYAYDGASAAWKYAQEYDACTRGENGTIAITRPIVVFINSNNKVVYAAQGFDDEFIDTIRTYLGISLEKERIYLDNVGTVTLNKTSYEYTGKEIIPSVTVKHGDKTLVRGVDYEIFLENNVNVGVGTLYVYGIGDYKRIIITNFTIVGKDAVEEDKDAPAMIDGYYMLSSKEDLTWFANKVNSGNSNINAKLINDIAVNGVFTPIGKCTGHTVGAHYEGKFDGQGHTVSGIKVSNEFYAGLFGGLKGSAEIKNVGVINSTISGTKGCGAIAGGTTIVDNSVSISGCWSENNTITANYADGSNAGGLIGGMWNDKGSISNSYVGSNVTIKATGSTSDFAGGLVAYFHGGAIKNCFTLATVTGTKTGTYAGDFDGTPVNCYSGKDARFASGEIAYLLNENGANTVWYQTLSQDKYPVLVSDGNNTLYVLSGYEHGSDELSYYFSNSKIKNNVLHSEAYNSATKNHDACLDSGVVVKAPTVYEEGAMLYSCTTCTYTITKPIEKIKNTEVLGSIEEATVTLSKDSYVYSGDICMPTVKVVFGGKTLTTGTDYTVDYSNNINAGKASVKITGAGKYTGSVTKSFTITKKSVADLTITIPADSYKYTGRAITPAVTVKNGQAVLKEKEAYTLSYTNNTNIGLATVTVTGAGNYTGTKAISFSIEKEVEPVVLKKDIANKDKFYVEFLYDNDELQTYTGNEIKPVVWVYDREERLVLKENENYKVEYLNNINAGTATVVVTGIGDKYEGEVKLYFTIQEAESVDEETTITLDQETFTYTGYEIKPVPTVMYGTTKLINGTDYTVRYANNVNVGTGTVYITGKGDYEGTISTTFKITQAQISSARITLAQDKYYYTGRAIEPEVGVSYNGISLSETRDYSVSYKSNTAVGEATITITGKGNFAGTVEKNFTIEKQKSEEKIDISDETKIIVEFLYFDEKVPNIKYTGSAIEPDVWVYNKSVGTMRLGTDYTVGYANNKEVGTAIVTVTGIGKYTGEVTLNFNITSSGSSVTPEPETPLYLDIADCYVEFDKKSYTYTGRAIRPSFTVYYDYDKYMDFAVANGYLAEEDLYDDEYYGLGYYVELDEGYLNDYEVVEYKNNIKPGKGYLVLEGWGLFDGEAEFEFTIAKGTSKITLKDKSATYSGKAISISAATVTGSKGNVTYTYYVDKACKTKTGTTAALGGAAKAGAAPKNAGTYYVKASVAADLYYKAATSAVAKLTIKKAYNDIYVGPASKTLRYSKSKKLTFTEKATVYEKAAVTFAKVKGDRKITITKAGKVTIAKGLKRGKYSLKLKVKSAATRNYLATEGTVTIKIIIK